MGESSNQDKDEKSSSSNQLPNINPEELARKIRELQIGSASSARDLAEAQSRKYQFWSTQPVPQFNKTEAEEAITENEYIEAPIEIDRIRKQPYSLPGDNFMWSDVDLNDEAELLELYSLLSDNYVEDDECMFRFDYSKDFLKWALMPPGWRKDWHCGLRVAKSKKLVAFIGAIPCNMQVRDKSVEMVEINFLCVHKQLRSKRVTPVLVKEITRRVNLTGIFQAAFTAGVVLPKPITTSRYWHRSLNPEKAY
ncbi:Glycylpeptide N-tetradecanoyltransferase [Aphelenchoides bicaudatus]|nr:Glycylpeptide N-tetradecanoyltransferase [Aphelenchoides bicaudatus]